MIDAGSISSAIGSLKVAADITKGFLDLKEAAALQGKVIELQGAILSAQSSALTAQSDQMTLLEEIRSLKEKMAKLEAWEAEKERYELKDVGLGSLAFVVKESVRGSEPPHKICATCFQHRKKSILQPYTEGYDRFLECPECKTALHIEKIPFESSFA